MTNDRNYSWAKEYKEEAIIVAKNYGFKIITSDEINVDDINCHLKES
jgi:hypothetical protein